MRSTQRLDCEARNLACVTATGWCSNNYFMYLSFVLKFLLTVNDSLGFLTTAVGQVNNRARVLTKPSC